MLSKLPLLDSGWSECREVFGQVLMSRRKICISMCAIMVMLEHLCNTLNEILCIRHFYYLVIGRGFCGRGRKEKQFSWFLVSHLAFCLCVSAANVSNIEMRRPTYQEHWDVKRCEIKFQQVVRYMLARKFNFHFLSLMRCFKWKHQLLVTCEPACVSFFSIFSSVKRFETSLSWSLMEFPG